MPIYCSRILFKEKIKSSIVINYLFNCEQNKFLRILNHTQPFETLYMKAKFECRHTMFCTNTNFLTRIQFEILVLYLIMNKFKHKISIANNNS